MRLAISPPRLYPVQAAITHLDGLETPRSLFQNIVQHATDGIVVVDFDGYVIHSNPAAEALFQAGHEDFHGQMFGFPIVANQSSEIDLVRPEGTMLVAEMRVSEARWDGKRVLIAMFRDITQRKQMERNLLLNSKIFANTQEGILVTDAAGIIRSVNQAFVSVTGYTEEEALGRKPSLLSSGRHDRSFYAAMWHALIEQGQWRGEIWNRRKNGEIYPEWINISAIHDDAGTLSHFVAIFSDITKVKQNEEKLRHLAHFDALTGLPNRFLFQDHVELALARAERNDKQVAILFLDLDRFKLINDTLGHRAGDTLLTEVGQRLAACLRSSDTLSRFGGDEFTVVLPDLDSGGAAATVAEKFLEALSADFHIAGKRFHITVSIGIALYPQDGEHLDSLSRAADAAMFAAKDHGRNTYRFHALDGRDLESTRRFHLENLLRRALERGEMSVVYQPEIDVGSGRITGMEALLRWHTPEFGEILPEEFIPLAEDIGIVSTLGNWILREACRQNKAWQDAGMPPICVSVNLSPIQLGDRRLLDTIREVLAETGLDGRWLELELTEGTLMQNIEASLQTFNALKQLGVRLSIDDFGYGYSSLGYLRRLPVDTLKIDPSFVAHIASNPDDAVISRGIVDLAGKLNLRVVAEGVESLEQLDMLREFRHCHAQGFYFSQPLPAVHMTSLLGNRELHTWRQPDSLSRQ